MYSTGKTLVDFALLHFVLPGQTCQNGYHQKTTNNKYWWGCGEHLYTVGGNINWCNYCGSIIMNKTSGGDGIPAEVFQILKGDAVKVLYSICQ